MTRIYRTKEALPSEGEEAAHPRRASVASSIREAKGEERKIKADEVHYFESNNTLGSPERSN